jgi:hypothetical protein
MTQTGDAPPMQSTAPIGAGSVALTFRTLGGLERDEIGRDDG